MIRSTNSFEFVDSASLPIREGRETYDAHTALLGTRVRPGRRNVTSDRHSAPMVPRPRSRSSDVVRRACTGAAIQRELLANLNGYRGRTGSEAFGFRPAQTYDAPSSSSSSSSSSASSMGAQWTNIARHASSSILTDPTPTRRLPIDMVPPQSLPELYLEVVRLNRNRMCFQCSEYFEPRQLQLGYTVFTASHHYQPARWIHVDCAQAADLRILAGVTTMAVNPGIPMDVSLGVVDKLRNVSRLDGANLLRKWNYLSASVSSWHQVLIIEDEGQRRPPSVDDQMSQDRERTVSRILSSLPSSLLDYDMDEDDPCAVCQAPMTKGSMICRLPCQHTYHVGCIDTWLRVRMTCPLDNLCIAKMLECAPSENNASALIVLE